MQVGGRDPGSRFGPAAPVFPVTIPLLAGDLRRRRRPVLAAWWWFIVLDLASTFFL